MIMVQLVFNDIHDPVYSDITHHTLSKPFMNTQQTMIYSDLTIMNIVKLPAERKPNSHLLQP